MLREMHEGNLKDKNEEKMKKLSLYKRYIRNSHLIYEFRNIDGFLTIESLKYGYEFVTLELKNQIKSWRRG